MPKQPKGEDEYFGYKQIGHKTGEFYENLISQVVEGMIVHVNGVPDILLRNGYWIECKGSGNTSKFLLRLPQFERLLQPSKWRKELPEGFAETRFKWNGFYAFAWFRNGRWDPLSATVQRMLCRKAICAEQVFEFLAEETTRICIISVHLIDLARKNGTLKTVKVTYRPNPNAPVVKIPAIKVNGSSLKALEQSPYELLRSWKVNPANYKVSTILVGKDVMVEGKSYPLKEFPLTVIASRRQPDLIPKPVFVQHELFTENVMASP